MLIEQLNKIDKENADCIRIVDFMSQECILMKNRLTNLLDIFDASYILEWAENFQNQVLMKEEALELIKVDLKNQEHLLAKGFLKLSDDLFQTAVERQEKIRRQIQYMEKDCLNMKHAFDQFVSSHLLQ